MADRANNVEDSCAQALQALILCLHKMDTSEEVTMGDRMGASGDGPSFREMREALERYVQEHGLRFFSLEMAMSPSSVDSVVQGGIGPSAPTVWKLRWFYLRTASWLSSTDGQGGELMATEFGDGPALQVMRDAAGQYIDAKGLRAFARELRMSPSGADKVVKAETQPRGPTVRKLRRWYLQTYEAWLRDGTAEGPALVGIRLLVQDLPRERQKATALRMNDVLREAFGEGGARPPRWVSRLKRLIETEWA